MRRDHQQGRLFTFEFLWRLTEADLDAIDGERRASEPRDADVQPSRERPAAEAR